MFTVRKFGCASLLTVILSLLSHVGNAADQSAPGSGAQGMMMEHHRISIVEVVQNADSAADHEAVAKLFDEDAAAYDKAAVDHETLAHQYGKAKSYFRWHDKTAELASHCNALAKSLREAASSARKLAQMHRDIAKLRAAQPK